MFSPPSLSPTLSSSSSSIFSSSPPTTHPSSITHLHSTHTTAGYRDGISLSKTPTSLQAGFDEGYSLGAVLGLRVGYILGVFEALRYYHRRDGKEAEGEGGGGGGGGKRRGERLLMEAKRGLRMEEVFKEEYFGGDGVWKFDVGGEGPHRRGDTLTEAIAREKMEEGGGGESATFFDVADLHPLIREWMQKAKDEMKRCGVEDWKIIEAESQPDK